MHKINIPLNLGSASYNAGDVADLSAVSLLDIARMEAEWRTDLQAFVIERVVEPVIEAAPADDAPAADETPTDGAPAAPSKRKR